MKAKELMIGAKPFSNGTEALAWIEHNCENCIKFCKSTDGMPRCKVAKELMLGFFGNDQFCQRTMEFTAVNDCPSRLEHYPKHKNRKEHKSQLKLDL